MLPLLQIVISFVLLTSVKTDATFLTTDYLQNGYIITSGNEFQKVDSSGNLLVTYNQNRYGKLFFADATNPLRLVLSYPDYGTVVMLDNNLSEVNALSLRKINIQSYSATCFSSIDNNIWVFDDQDFKLKKIDRNNDIVIESGDLFSLLGKALHPVFMQEDDQYVYLTDPDEGIVIFDIYGTYYQTLPFKNIHKFQVRSGQLFFQEAETLRSYELKTLELKNIALPDAAQVIDVRIEKSRLYVLRQGQLDIYSY
ncbi:MAG: hypothetical protein IPO83_09255 [Chitinophagaceae bacterium]|nr:hypothetical protein [Chitinophagaceae bacterium]